MKRVRDADIGAIRGVTKVGIGRVLRAASQAGLLPDEQRSLRTIRGDVQHAVELTGREETPYGPLIQMLDLPSEKVPKWEYVHPMAYLYYICTISKAFFDVMKASIDGCKVLLYIDEINPGDSLHFYQGRKLQCVYWALSTWPQHLLQRKDMWILLGVLRSIIVNKLPAGISGFCAHVLRIFFPERGFSFLNGCTIRFGTESLMFIARFLGWIADEKALKEIFDIKGQAGQSPCFNCNNVVRFIQPTRGSRFVKLSCTDPSLFELRTNAQLRTMLDRISSAATKTARETLEKSFGINYCPGGLLFDAYLFNNVLDPINNYLRDPMHTLSSNGVAGTHIALVVQELQGQGVSLDIIQTYAKQFTLPKSRGKVSDLYFQDAMLDTDHVRHFASDVLGMIPILHTFMEEKIKPRGWLPDHLKCFAMLFYIMCVLRSCAPVASVIEKLRRLIAAHAELFISLYGEDQAKPKFHHLLHLSDNVLLIARMIACFVTERKHRDIKITALHVFSNPEHTIVHDFLNNAISHVKHDTHCFSRWYLVSPKPAAFQGRELQRSKDCYMHCGSISSGDVVYFVDRSVAVVIDFWQEVGDHDIFAHVKAYSPIDAVHWDTTAPIDNWSSIEDIYEPVPYYAPRPGCIRIVPPYKPQEE